MGERYSFSEDGKGTFWGLELGRMMICRIIEIKSRKIRATESSTLPGLVKFGQ